MTLRVHVLGPLFKHTEIWFHPVLPTVLNRKQLPAVRIFEVLELSITHIRSVHILRCSQHGPQEVFGLLGRIPKLKQCVYVRLPPLPYRHRVTAYCCIRLTFLRIECEQSSTYNGDGTLKPDGHRDPSDMLPRSLSFFPDVGTFTRSSFWKPLRFTKPLRTQ
jgi:hypothetical protein